jgi:thiol-disulfide isomerase/thioredoxin
MPRTWSAAVLLMVALGVPAARAAAPAPSPESATAALATHALQRVGQVPGQAASQLTLSSLRGQVVVLNFWASWCGPCRKELPQLRSLASDLAASNTRVIPVSIDSDPRNAAEFANRFAPGLTVYHDGPDGLARSLDLPALPYTFVLDRDGRMLWSGGGADAATLATIGTTARKAAETHGLAGATEGTTR